MNDSSDNDKSSALRLVEASAWQTRLWENDLESTPDFEAWLISHPGNRQAWNRVQQSWDLFGEHATSPELLDLRRRALGKIRGMGRERWATRYPWISRFGRAAIAAGVLILAVGGAITFKVFSPDVYRTGAGERRVVTLADGSQVQLDSLTELHVSYSERARDLQLVKGQARFDVAHDVERPFAVVAAGKKVVATGTAFNIDLLGNSLFVTLIEGEVVVLPQTASVLHIAPAVSSPPQAGSALPKAAPSTPKPRIEPIELQAGQQLAISEDGEATVAPASVQRTTAWQSGQLVFENETLSSVVRRVNRYSTRPIALTDEKVASLRLSGVFSAGDVDGFVSTVTHYLPVEAEYSDDGIYLSAR